MVSHSSGRDEDGAVPKAAAALFDTEFYLLQNPDVAASGFPPFDHFWATGRFEGRNPNILFDGLFYRSQVRGTLIEADPVTDYILHGAARDRSPHPLFDVVHYVATANDLSASDNPLQHYLTRGWRKGLSPHPLFDPTYYALSAGLRLPAVEPLGHYLSQTDHEFCPHYLFSDAIYTAQLSGGNDVLRGDAPLTHYVKSGFSLGLNTHPLFDVEHYLEALGRWKSSNPVAAVDAVPAPIEDALRHYVGTGWRLGLSPTPYFDPKFYGRQAGRKIVGDPLRDYLMPGGFSRHPPHPAVDLHTYASRANLLLDDSPGLLHLLASADAERVSPHPFLDLDFYAAVNRDRIKAGDSPVLHFLREGMDDDLAPNFFYSADYVRNLRPEASFADQSALALYLGSDVPKRLRIVFVSHDASLTGAPGTVLRLIEDFAGLTNVECFAIVGNGGPRVTDFRRAAHTLVLNTPFYSAPAERLRHAAGQLMAITAGNEPVVAVVNSAESRAMGAELAAAGIPVITLVHEAADLYPPGSFETIVRNSKKVVFGSQYVLDRAKSVVELRDEATLVRGQGLQQDCIGTMPRAEARRKVLKELGLLADVFLVLGCGTIDYRKGADLFVTAALDYLSRPGLPRACFVWVGDGHDRILRSFIETQIERHEHELDIQFVGGRDDVEPYFVAGDAFLMTSRADPFPCVCQEAMATGLPIVAFAEGGGTIEMIGDEAGHCVPLADTTAMADKLALLASDPELRERLGARGRHLVREKWRAIDYAEFMAGLAAEVAGIDRAALGAPLVPPDRDGRRVLMLFDEWHSSAACRAGEKLANELNLQGFEAEIVVTRGRFSGPTRLAPQAPHRYLQPKGVQPNEVALNLLRLVREPGRCIVIAAADAVTTSIAPLLPTTAALVLQLESADDDTVEASYRLAPDADCIIAPNAEAARALLTLNPGLDDKLVTIRRPSVVAPGSPDRDLLYIHADLANREHVGAIVRTCAELRRLGLDLKLCVHAHPAGPGGYGDLRLTGINAAVMLFDPPVALLAEHLAKARFALFLDGRQLEYRLLLEALGAGCVPVVVDALSPVLALGEAVVPAWGIHPKALARRIFRLSSNASPHDAAARQWLEGNTLSQERHTERYTQLLNELFERIAT